MSTSQNLPKLYVARFMKVVGKKAFCLQFRERFFDEEVPQQVYRQQNRVPKEVVDFLEGKLQGQLQHPTQRNSPLTTREQVIEHVAWSNYLGFSLGI